MSARHDSSDGPEDIDAAFAEIVAGLERDAPMARWPEDPATAGNDVEDTIPGGSPGGGETPTQGPRDWEPPRAEEDEGHFEPPEPPPLSAPRPSTLGGIAVVALGVLLLMVPGLAGLASTTALPLGMIAISGGITWLLFRMRRGPPRDDDGAQL